MEWLQNLLDSSTVPLVTAFLLGLLTAISPCPLATNITAIGFISKDIESRHRIFWNGMLYTLGRIITYAGIGFILIPILREGASIYAIQKTIGKYGEIVIAPALILIGLFMLFGSKLNLPQAGFNSGGEKLGKRGGIGALLLGILFSLAFCPSSGVFYFGMLIPMSAAETGGYLLPFAFAIATGLPVIVVAWILAYSMAGLGKFYHCMQTFQKWMNFVIALLFIAVGIYYAIILWL
ncbi:aromatic aminobenezylarsenical efflux permease ArsG family transporter [Bacteroides sp.]|uniref:aromatic aminobenezylarsenical efflux permease ArsG family transporter n=1 Tax=Bacteroides sp. TaxID=29523 RepID=UPI00261A2BE6|nr:aromatic aminobenezylarsenical efflux permease ArsG family transporter [Bacteroides sp.]MDD3037436.1 aromatic aminobenezylarsenical efflux permease ArsG family transporter [Bacteroides sp.]